MPLCNLNCDQIQIQLDLLHFTLHNLDLEYLVKSAVADPGFSPGGAPTPKSAIIFQFFAKNCMKMKEFGPPGGRASLAPPLGSANDHVFMKRDISIEFNLNFQELV